MAMGGEQTRLGRRPIPTSRTAGIWLAALFLLLLLVTLCAPAFSSVLTVTSVPAAGGTTTGAGTYASGAAVALTATPNPGYTFVGWTTDAAGLSFKKTYGYTMPATDTTLYAQFSTGTSLFSDNFESYADGPLLEGQGWWTVDYPNGNGPSNQAVYLSKWSIPQLPNSTRYAAGVAGYDNDGDCVNLAYRCGGGSNLMGNYVVRWMFYDPLPSNGANFTDSFCLSNIGGVPSNKDCSSAETYSWTIPNLQRIQVGANGTYPAGYDRLKYQVRCVGYADGLGGSNWFNTTVSRSKGWHEGTIIVGSPYANGTTMFTIVIDSTTVFQRNSISAAGINLLETLSAYTNTPGAFDNISVVSTQWPNVTDLTVPATSTSKTVTASWSAANSDHSLLQLDGGAWTDPAASPAPVVVAAYGTHTVKVKSVNSDGQTSPTLSASVVVDIPVTGLAVSPSPVAPGTSPIATWTGTGGDHFMLKIDSGTWSQQSAPYNIDTTTLLAGTHTVSVKAVDVDGVEGSTATANFVVDVPIVGLVVAPATVAPGSPAQASWTGTGAVDHFMLNIDNGAWSQQASPYSIDTAVLPYGKHTVFVKAVLASGAEGLVYSTPFIVDRSILTWNIIGHYPWGTSSTDPAPGKYAKDFFAPATTELAAGAKTGTGYPTNPVQPTAQGGGIAYTTWTPCTSLTPIVDLNVVYNTPTTYTQYGVSYLCTYVWNNSGADIANAYLTAGSDDGIKAFWNGVNIGGNNASRGCIVDQDIYGPFTVKKGGNKLLLKLVQGSQGYQIQAQLCDSTRMELPAVASGQIAYTVSDGTGPTGGISINNGAATANSYIVTLSLTANDAEQNGVATMSFSNDQTTWSDPVPFAATAQWQLSDQSGPKIVYARYTDSLGNMSAVFSDDIIVPNGWTMTTINCDTAAGNPSPGGVYAKNASVRLLANPMPGYTFVAWTRDGCPVPGDPPGDVASTNPDYTFPMPDGDYYLWAYYVPTPNTMTATVCSGGHVTGAGTYKTGSPVNLVATADTNYQFKNWTTDSCGGTAVVSTDASYSFNMPPNSYTLYANFSYTPLLTLVSVPATSGSVTGGGVRATAGVGTPISATPIAGCNFVAWTTDPAGASVVTTAPTFNYTMPATDTTLYAQFATAHNIFSEGFETYNPDVMLDFQGPWVSNWPGLGGSGPYTDLFVRPTINGITPHGGNQMVTGQGIADYDSCLVDLAYHGGGGANLVGSYQVDWWFYDPNGAVNGAGYTDAFILSQLAGMPGTRDPVASDIPTGNYIQRVMVGGLGTGDVTKYQARIIGYLSTDGSGAFNDQGWFNTNTPRTVGWHHGTIVAGPKLSDNTNLLGIYIDGVLALEKNSKSPGGFNAAEMNCAFTPSTVAGATYGAFDDITISTNELPTVNGLAVTPNIVTSASPVSVTWTTAYADHSMIKVDSGNWTDPATSPYPVDTTGFVYNSTHTVSVKCVNAAGQASAVYSVTFVVDRSSIRTWNVIGHYPWDGPITNPDGSITPGVAGTSTRWTKDFFDAPGISEPTMCAKTGTSYATSVTPAPNASWTPYTSPTPKVDFNVLYNTVAVPNTEWGVTYLFTYVVNNGPDAIQNAFISTGTDDGIKVWFNGVYQGGKDLYRGCAADTDIFPATGGFTINPGGNRLLIKVTQGSTGYQAIARLCSYDAVTATRTDPAWLSQLTYVASDNTAPTGTISAPPTSSSANVTLTLSATDDLSGVAKMQFSNDGSIYVAPIAYATSVPYTLPSGGGAKTVYVKFIDGAGNVSAPYSTTITVSSGPQAPPACIPVAKISDLWQYLNDGTVYGLDNANEKTVTAVWPDGSFWVEEANRYAGIKVVPAVGAYTYFDDGAKSAIVAGDMVDIYGTLSVPANADRVFNASYVRDRTVGVGTAIKPLGVTERYIVGKQASSYTPGLPSAKGIYSAGLLVKLAGTVVGTSGSNYFFLDDKTMTTVGGIKIFFGGTIPTTGNKVVTGVVGMVNNAPVIYATSVQ